jgi:hypothetical protein
MIGEIIGDAVSGVARLFGADIACRFLNRLLIGLPGYFILHVIFGIRNSEPETWKARAVGWLLWFAITGGLYALWRIQQH